jgi:hypothetical protein
VSDVEKAHEMCQVGIGRTVRSPRFRDRRERERVNSIAVLGSFLPLSALNVQGDESAALVEFLA